MIIKINPFNYLVFRKTLKFDDIAGLSLKELVMLTLDTLPFHQSNRNDHVIARLKMVLMDRYNEYYFHEHKDLYFQANHYDKIISNVFACTAYLFKDLSGFLNQCIENNLNIVAVYWENNDLIITADKMPSFDIGDLVKNANLSHPARNRTKHGEFLSPRYLSDIQYRSPYNVCDSTDTW